MTPNNLRSVVALVTRGGSSAVSRRNLSTRYRHDFSSSDSGSSNFALFGSRFMYGVFFVAGFETIRVVEYGQTMQRSLDESAGRESEAPLRDFLRAVVRCMVYGEPY